MLDDDAIHVLPAKLANKSEDLIHKIDWRQLVVYSAVSFQRFFLLVHRANPLPKPLKKILEESTRLLWKAQLLTKRRIRRGWRENFWWYIYHPPLPEMIKDIVLFAVH